MLFQQKRLTFKTSLKKLIKPELHLNANVIYQIDNIS